MISSGTPTIAGFGKPSESNTKTKTYNKVKNISSQNLDKVPGSTETDTETADNENMFHVKTCKNMECINVNDDNINTSSNHDVDC